MKKKFGLILLLSSLLYNTANAKTLDKNVFNSPVYDFDENQLNNFELAYKYGRAIGYQKVMMAIMYIESSAKNIPIGDRVNAPFKRSYGIMQVKIGTYYWMFNKGYLYGENLLEEEILHKLMYNKSFNVYAATSYYKFLLDYCGNYTDAIVAYNRGSCKPTKESDIKAGENYLRKVNKFLKFINQYNFDDFIKERMEK